MNNQEIKQELLSILQKINNNGINSWNADLNDTIEAVAVEDYYGDTESEEPTTIYNGWLDDIESLIKKL
jgi:hypothetical protein